MVAEHLVKASAWFCWKRRSQERLLSLPRSVDREDAFVDCVTGVAPVDETADALAAVLGDLLEDRVRLEQMGKHAAEWARSYFQPQQYAGQAVVRLL